jgi:hypothetical protein
VTIQLSIAAITHLGENVTSTLASSPSSRQRAPAHYYQSPKYRHTAMTLDAHSPGDLKSGGFETPSKIFTLAHVVLNLYQNKFSGTIATRARTASLVLSHVTTTTHKARRASRPPQRHLHQASPGSDTPRTGQNAALHRQRSFLPTISWASPR